MMKAILIFTLMCTCVDPAHGRKQPPLATAPFELVGEKLFIKGRVNGSEEMNLQFDTGAGSASIDDSTAKQLELMASGETRNEGAAGSASVPTSTNNTIEVGGLRFSDITLMHFHLGEYFGARRDIVIGYDMLKPYVVKIDYDTRTMEFHDAKRFKYSGRGKAVRFSLWSQSALMDMDLILLSGEHLRGKVLVDTGADLPLLLNSPFVDKHGLMQKVGKTARGSISGSDGSEVPTFRGKVQKATIGGFTYGEFPVRLAQARSGTLSLNDLDGVLGNPILKMFNITYDYRRMKMYWEPNQFFSQKVR